MNGQFNVWNKWDPLKTVMLGDCYGPEFFRDIKNPRIRSALDRIATETKEDLEFYEKILKDFSCQVVRPELDKNQSIMGFIDDEGRIRGQQGIPRAPLQPRDAQMVLGTSLYFTGVKDHPSIKNKLIEYNLDKSGLRVLSTSELIAAPCFTIVGKDLYVDKITTSAADVLKHEGHNDVRDNHFRHIKKNTPGVRINTLSIGGHNDGCFHTLKPNAILSLRQIQDYEKTFPGWDVCYLPNQSWDLLTDFIKMKKKVDGRWWVPGEEENDEFTYFVETWLQDWVGYCEESVFDVNVLMLDDRHVCVNNYNETAFAFFKKHNIEPIIIPWRHRYFWDGGLHCITLDLYREGEMQDYFPARSEPIVDLGFD